MLFNCMREHFLGEGLSASWPIHLILKLVDTL
jgi:hypothetical protein